METATILDLSYTQSTFTTGNTESVATLTMIHVSC